MLKYANCVMPNTKPDLHFDEKGICSACNFFKIENDKLVKRKAELEKIIDIYRDKSGAKWDCVVPVSGGDSTFQV